MYDADDCDDLRSAFLRGIPGFAGKLTDLAGQVLVSIEMPSAWQARDWVLTLMSMRNAGFPRGAADTTAGVPLDNQIATALFPPVGGVVPPERASYRIAGVYLEVQWGSGNARERAFVSYPYGGGSFVLHGASIRVQLPGGMQSVGTGVIKEGIPNLGGFVALGSRSQSALPPTLMTEMQDVFDASPVDFYAPPRAVGYRLWTVDDLDVLVPSPVLRVDQLVWLVGVPTPLAVDGTNVDAYRSNSNALEVSGANAWQRSTRGAHDWAHLLPRAVGIRISTTNVDEAHAQAVGVEWILDLG